MVLTDKNQDKSSSSTYDYISNHIENVKRRLLRFSQILWERGIQHDKSKLEEPEYSLWCKMDEEPRFPYGSKEYEEKVSRWRFLFNLHFKKNRHHPEHFKLKDYDDKDLIDLIEMLCDWLGYRDNISYAAASRLVSNQCDRYGFSEELKDILLNTLKNWFVEFGGVPTVDFNKLEKHIKNDGLGKNVDIYV